MHLGSVEHSQSSLRYLLPFRNNAPALFSGSEEAVGCFGMELNTSFPAPGCQELTEVDDECKHRTFCEKPMATEAAVAAVGEERKGYVV